MKRNYSNLRKLIPFAIVAIVITMLASCSSSNQMASSFSKRKYMPGRFSDPIAKVKTGAANTIASVANDTKNVVNEIKTLAKAEKTTEPSAIAQAKPVYIKADKPKLAAKASAQSHLAAKAVVMAVDKKEVNSTEQTSSVYASPNSLESTMSDNGGHHHYFGYFLICLLLMLLFLILAAGSAVSGSGGGALLFVLLYIFAGIAALVFLVLWIINLAS
jgi:hypothetical protein